jgi:tetratricopeptide (TPR) repeat protein
MTTNENELIRALSALDNDTSGDGTVEQRLVRFHASLQRMHNDPAEAARIDAIIANHLAWQGRSRRLASLLVEQGRHPEAEEVLRDLATAGNARAARQLAYLLIQQKRADDAVPILRELAAAGDDRAARRLAGLLTKLVRVSELREQAAAGNPHAARRLADHLAERGQEAEALDILRERVALGDEVAKVRLDGLRDAMQGRANEPATIEDDADNWLLVQQLTNATEQGRKVEAEKILLDEKASPDDVAPRLHRVQVLDRRARRHRSWPRLQLTTGLVP